MFEIFLFGEVSSVTCSNYGIYSVRVLINLYSNQIYSQCIVDVPSLSCTVFVDVPSLSITLYDILLAMALTLYVGRFVTL